jgi:hypothetical protein
MVKEDGFSKKHTSSYINQFILEMMQNIEDITYHIYLKDKPIYWNLDEDGFDEKWQMLHVMMDLLDTDYEKEDLTYTKLSGKVGYGGPGKVVYTSPIDEDSY